MEGTLFGDRFEAVRLATRGGMGLVYEARDAQSGARIALKLMPRGEGADVRRFQHEARLLAQITHPGVVAYVGHGETEAGAPWLAMEWLEGEDLGRRLERKGLSVGETLGLGRAVASALSAVHARGVIHRDLKPSNVFLVDGDPLRPKLLDFGVARLLVRTSRGPTHTNAMVGTLGYMAPEQAKGVEQIDARADLFSLGCLLFECLTGQPTFTGSHAVAVLAKVLMEEAPRLRSVRAELPEALDALVARLLAKDPQLRPEGAHAVEAELDALEGQARSSERAPARPPRRVITDSEQRLVSVLLVDAETLDAEAVRSVAQRFGGDMVPIAGEALLVTLPGAGNATDRAVQAATCGLSIARAQPEARVALSTGTASTSGTFPVGPVIDRAAQLLREAEASPGLIVDAVTASLMGARFELQPERAHFRCLAPHAEEGTRTLLGRPTPCVGRERELAAIERLLDESASEPHARALLVTAPAGFGKSRLRHEALGLAKARGLRILSAGSDAVGAGSSFALAQQLVRRGLGLRELDPEAEQHARLHTALSELGVRDVGRVADFLGELVHAPSAEPGPQLRAVRTDPRLLGDWEERSLLDWLEAECVRAPVLVLLEDLQWADAASVRALGAALKRCEERPLAVLAFGRTEVHEAFPSLWSSVSVEELRLGGLPRRAAEKLVHEVLGEVPAPLVAQLVERADGNAFYLEELIRRVAEGAGEALPDSVLVMAQSRLEQLERHERRVLRAASVFGESFAVRGVCALVGEGLSEHDVSETVAQLTAREVLQRVALDDPMETRAHAFRHALLRDAAYAMLTHDDRVLAHGLAGQWLERSGEKDPLVLAEHYERGGDSERAIPWIVRGAQAAFSRSQMAETVALGERAVRLGAAGVSLGTLRALESIAYTGLSKVRDAISSATEALGLLKAGSDDWFLAAASQVLLSSYSGDSSAALQVLLTLLGLPIEATPPSRAQGLATLMLASGCYTIGQADAARMLKKRLLAVAAAHAPVDAISRGWMGITEQLDIYDHRFERAWRGPDEAVAPLAESGDGLGHAFALLLRGVTELEALAFDRAIDTLESAKAPAAASAPFVREWVHVYQGRALCLAGRLREGLDTLAPVLNVAELNKQLRARSFEAEAHLLGGALDEAEQKTELLFARGAQLPGIVLCAHGILARIALARGDFERALGAAERGVALAGSVAAYPMDGSIAHRAQLDALRALGREIEPARSEARARVERIAETFGGLSALREAYLGAAVHLI